MLGINRITSLIYTIEGKLYGTSLMFFRKDQPDPSKEILENFVHLTSESLQRRRIEKALRESETKFRTLFEKASDGICLIDLNGNLILTNESFARIHNYSPEEMVNMNLKDLATPDTYVDMLSRINRILTGETLTYEVTHYHRQRKIIHLDVIASTIKLSNVLYIIAFHRDVTDRIKASEELKSRMDQLTRLNSELEQYTYANQELKQFAYTASHQLQEPIRTVSNFTHIIEEDYSGQLDSTGMKHLHTIQDATSRMAALINTLLEYSQLGRNPRVATVDIRLLLDNVISDLESLIKSSKAVIEITDMPVIVCYEVEVYQLFQNLLTNAIKFQPGNHIPHIRINSEKIGNKWKFSIRDNGIGISPRYFDRIFEIFQRLHTNEDEYDGKGIGLAYCKKIVQMHFGEIWAESEIGKGSTFYFILPESVASY